MRERTPLRSSPAVPAGIWHRGCKEVRRCQTFSFRSRRRGSGMEGDEGRTSLRSSPAALACIRDNRPLKSM